MRGPLLLLFLVPILLSLTSYASWSSVQSFSQYSFLNYNGDLFGSLIYKAVVLDPYSTVYYNLTLKYLFSNVTQSQLLVYKINATGGLITVETKNLTVVAVVASTSYGDFPLQEVLSNGTLKFFGYYPNVTELAIYVTNGSNLLEFLQVVKNGTYSVGFTGLLPEKIGISLTTTYASPMNVSFSTPGSFNYFGQRFSVTFQKSYGFYETLPSVLCISSGTVTLSGTYTLVTVSNNVLTVTYFPKFHYSFYGIKAYSQGGPAFEMSALGMVNETTNFTVPGYGVMSSYTFFLNETLNQTTKISPFQYDVFFHGIPLAFNTSGVLASVVPVKVIAVTRSGILAGVNGSLAFLNSTGAFLVNRVTEYRVMNVTISGVTFEAIEVSLPQGISLVQVPRLANGSVAVVNSNMTQASGVIYFTERGSNVTALIQGAGVYYFIFESTGQTTTTTSTTTKTQTSVTTSTSSSATSLTTTSSTKTTTGTTVTTSSTTTSQTTSTTLQPSTTLTVSPQPSGNSNVVLIAIIALVVIIAVAAVLLLRRK